VTTELAGSTPQAPEPPAAPGAPHVVLIVGNPVISDARVRKSALSAAAFGYRVSVVAYDPDIGLTEGERRDWIGPVEVVSVPVAFTLRDRAIETRRLRRRLIFPFGYGTLAAARAAAARRRIADLELMQDMGRGIERGDYSGRSVIGLAARTRRRYMKSWNRLRRKIVCARFGGSRVGRWGIGAGCCRSTSTSTSPSPR
jgi:hypothetical protein